MKKLVFSCLFAMTVANVTAQTLESDNYDSYTTGNVGTDVKGTAAGQGGMYTFNGANSDYQIVSVDAAHGKSLQITGGPAATNASSRFLWKDGLDAAWSGRMAGNDFLVANLEIYTGTATGKHRIGSIMYDAAGTGIVGITYNSETKTINGLARLVDASGNGGFYNITGLTNATFPANTWIKVGYSYNYSTGEITYTINGVTDALNIDGYTVPAGADPTEHDLTNIYNASNAATMTGAFDNVNVVASSTAVLAVGTVGKIDKSSVSIYPNPATDFIYFTDKAKSAQIFDMTGKSANSVRVVDNKVNVSNLPKGMYIIKFETEAGVQTEKFIKK